MNNMKLACAPCVMRGHAAADLSVPLSGLNLKRQISPMAGGRVGDPLYTLNMPIAHRLVLFVEMTCWLLLTGESGCAILSTCRSQTELHMHGQPERISKALASCKETAP